MCADFNKSYTHISVCASFFAISKIFLPTKIQTNRQGKA
jgi:hypothetical protein